MNKLLMITLVLLSGCTSTFEGSRPSTTRREKERTAFLECVQRFWDAGMTSQDAKEVCAISMEFPPR